MYLEEQKTLMQPSSESLHLKPRCYFLPSPSSQMLRKEKQVQQYLLPKPKIVLCLRIQHREHFAGTNRCLSDVQCPFFGGMEDWQSLAPSPAVSSQTEHTSHLHGATYITAKEFPFSSPLRHPDSIPVMDQCCYRHGTNWSEIQQIYTAAERRKTPSLKHM